MPLGVEVGLDPGNIVLDADPAPPTERGTAPPLLFGPCLLWSNGRHLTPCFCQRGFNSVKESYDRRRSDGPRLSYQPV